MTTYKISQVISPAFYDVHRQIKTGSLDEVTARGGRGSAKSSWASVEMILMLLRHPECHGVCFRAVGNTLRDSVYAQICWAITALGLASKFKCTVSPMECTYRLTGQKILFRGLDDPFKVKSIKLPFGYIGMLWFEELDQYRGPEEIRSVEQSCLRGGPFSFTFKTFNPPASSRNWANQYAAEQRDRQVIHHSTYLTTPTAWLGPRFIADAERLQEKNEIAYRTSRGGSDIAYCIRQDRRQKFQSTLPVGEATQGVHDLHVREAISIHASRGGSDLTAPPDQSEIINISIHASRGGSDPNP